MTSRDVKMGDLWVDPVKGRDDNDGTKQRPFRTLAGAMRYLNELPPTPVEEKRS